MPAGRAGFVAGIDTRDLGLAVVELGGGRRRPADRIDHAVGLESLIGLGAAVEPDTPLARIHAASEDALAAADRPGARRLPPRRRAAAGDALDPRADRLMARAMLMVMDSVGCGGAPDAAAFGDEGANTLGHIALACAAGRADTGRSGPLAVPNLAALGLGAAVRLASGIELPGFAETPSRPLGRRHRGLARQGHPLRPLGARRRAGALGLALLPATGRHPRRRHRAADRPRRTCRARSATPTPPACR